LVIKTSADRAPENQMAQGWSLPNHSFELPRPFNECTAVHGIRFAKNEMLRALKTNLRKQT
jgi:hypothetical protein